MRQARSRATTRVVRRSASGRSPRNRARINYAGLCVLFLISLVVSGVGSYVLRTSSLNVTEVRIHGVTLADRAAVEKAAKAALGRNILLLDKSRIASSISKLPEVKQVRIGRDFPNRVWVRVWEREPYAVLAHQGRFALLEQDGRVFHVASKQPSHAPLIEVKCPRIKPGATPASRALQYALEALRLAENQGLEPSKISVDPRGDMCLNMGSGFYVKFGQPDDIARKVSLLRTALVCKPSLAQQASYIDLSCPNAAAWMPRVSAQAQ